MDLVIVAMNAHLKNKLGTNLMEKIYLVIKNQHHQLIDWWKFNKLSPNQGSKIIKIASKKIVSSKPGG